MKFLIGKNKISCQESRRLNKVEPHEAALTQGPTPNSQPWRTNAIKRRIILSVLRCEMSEMNGYDENYIQPDPEIELHQSSETV